MILNRRVVSEQSRILGQNSKFWKEISEDMFPQAAFVLKEDKLC